jgi:Uncharacterized protein conserved in bacteria (DUF2066)
LFGGGIAGSVRGIKRAFGGIWELMAIRLFVAVLAFLALAGPLRAAGLVETGVYSVTGVEVDVVDKDAASAKTKAIIEAQVKAFGMLAERMGTPESAEELKKTAPDQIGRMLKSLSIEEERSGPGRYIGKLTVRFMPAKIKAAFGKYGIEPVEAQAPPVVVIPVWNTAQGPVLWEDNPWRKAWIDLRAEQSTVPIIVPLGDLEDTRMLTAEQAIAREPIMLDMIMQRYGTKSVLVAIAAPQEGDGVHAVMMGDSPLGKITFDKKYVSEPPAIDASAALAATRFHGVMLEKWRSIKSKAIAEARAREETRRQEQAALAPALQSQSAAAAPEAARPQSISASVPFSGPVEWNVIRRRIKNTPGISALDISAMSGNGAVVRIGFSASMESFRAALRGAGLRLDQVGGTWVIQPL